MRVVAEGALLVPGERAGRRAAPQEAGWLRLLWSELVAVAAAAQQPPPPPPAPAPALLLEPPTLAQPRLPPAKVGAMYMGSRAETIPTEGVEIL